MVASIVVDCRFFETCDSGPKEMQAIAFMSPRCAEGIDCDALYGVMRRSFRSTTAGIAKSSDLGRGGETLFRTLRLPGHSFFALLNIASAIDKRNNMNAGAAIQISGVPMNPIEKVAAKTVATKLSPITLTRSLP